MDTPKVLDALNEALVMERRSVIQFTVASGSVFGLQAQALTEKLWEFAHAELLDLRRLVEKVTALGGDPSTEQLPLEWSSDPETTVQHLIETEEEVVAALHAVIPHSGQQPDSEALEHLMEHLIMRKQNQVDWLRRAIRTP